MKKILFLGIAILSTNLYSAELTCSIFLNLTEVSRERVSTTLEKQKHIDTVEGIHSYITEKGDGRFLIEAYLADYDLRIYSEGYLHTSKDTIIASVYGRESIVDIECRLLVNSL